MYHVPGKVADPAKPPVFTQFVPVGTTILGTGINGEGVPLRVWGGEGVPVKVGVRVDVRVPVAEGLEPTEGERVAEEENDVVGVKERSMHASDTHPLPPFAPSAAPPLLDDA